MPETHDVYIPEDQRPIPDALKGDRRSYTVWSEEGGKNTAGICNDWEKHGWCVHHIAPLVGHMGYAGSFIVFHNPHHAGIV